MSNAEYIALVNRYMALRRKMLRLKLKRRSFKCQSEDHGPGSWDEPACGPCWYEVAEGLCSPEEMCDDCVASQKVHEEYLATVSEHTPALKALVREAKRRGVDA